MQRGSTCSRLPSGSYLRHGALQSKIPETAQRRLMWASWHRCATECARTGATHPSHAGNFFATATFFNVTYVGKPSLP